jgi:hypothetical protein
MYHSHCQFATKKDAIRQDQGSFESIEHLLVTVFQTLVATGTIVVLENNIRPAGIPPFHLCEHQFDLTPR